MNYGHLHNHLMGLARQREICMANARAVRGHVRNGLAGAEGITYWVLQARSYNAAICRVIHSNNQFGAERFAV